MKILIISSTPWDKNNSFGNTFSNLFAGMNDVEIYNICCQKGKNNNSIVKKAVQMTDKSVLKSIFKIGYDPVWEMNEETEKQKQDENTEVSVRAKKSRSTFAFIIRDIIWRLGSWKKSKTLNTFLEELKPDVIYLPIYASCFMCDIQSYIIKKLGAPVVGHISDDVYGYPENLSMIAKWHRTDLRKRLERLMAQCSYLEVFAENMKNEYEQIFQKPCFLIGKGVKKEEIPLSLYNLNTKKEEIKFVYTGNIGGERYKVLFELGQALEKLQLQQKVFLDIYSATDLDEEMKEKFSSCSKLRFKGAITKEEVEEVQKEADFLVHVEGFSPQAIYSAKMSFSTKIIDYMLIGKPIFAVGPVEVNSIKVLKNKKLAIVADGFGIINDNLERIFNQTIDVSSILKNVENYLREERDINKIQSGIKNRLNELVEKK